MHGWEAAEWSQKEEEARTRWLREPLAKKTATSPHRVQEVE